MLADIHAVMAWVVVVTNGVAGGWSLGAHWREALRSRALWVLVAVAQVAVFAQVILGVAHMQVDDIEAPEIHTFYGFLTLITVAIIHSYRQQVREQRYLLYGFGELFLMGLAIRAMVVR